MKGFSLIELMVVVAIVMFTAAIAVPVYQAYITRASVLSTIVYIEPAITGMSRSVSVDGSLPTSFQVDNQLLNYGSFIVVNDVQYIKFIQFYSAIDNPPGALLEVTIGNIPGLSTAQDYTFAIGIREKDGVMETACGALNQTEYAYGGLVQYLPSDCQCNDVDSWISGNSYYWLTNCPS